jgi:Spy/CpxP family protein refolding chaperone
MRKAILAISSVLILATPSLLAQRGGGYRPNAAAMVQRQVKHLTTLLDLTPGQQDSLTDLFTKNATSNQALASSMRSARQALSTAEKNNDSPGIQAASAQIGTLTGQMTLNRANLNAGIAQVLTTDQLTKYKALGGGKGPGFGGRGLGGSRGAPVGPKP